jgi:hypothetical protein
MKVADIVLVLKHGTPESREKLAGQLESEQQGPLSVFESLPADKKADFYRQNRAGILRQVSERQEADSKAGSDRDSAKAGAAARDRLAKIVEDRKLTIATNTKPGPVVLDD